VEKSVINIASIQEKSVEVKDLATVKLFQFQDSGSVEFQSKPADIYLFCLRQGQIHIQTSFIPHPIELSTGEAIFLAFPKAEWQAKIIHESNADLYTVRMEVSKLHSLINPVFDQQKLETAQKPNMRDLMKLIPVNPSLLGCFEQLLHHKLQHPFQSIFEQAKFLEIFSLIMESAFSQQMETCPVMMSPAIESKIHPDQLAIIYELPRNTLKEGYRYVYGKTIHQYHADHKLESAMQMLSSGELLVKEIAFKIGYQNPSHFISAFKKKYGYTPKQYLRQAQA
jgi:AraC family transcriptional activator of pyochelin receptor